jgi:hypothetical protein
MNKKKYSFVKRGILLGSGAVLLFVVLVLATYPYERAIDRALSSISETSALSVASSETLFSFPNRITFYDMTVTPKQRPYHLLETKLTKLSTEIGLRALVARSLRVRLDGEIDTGDPAEGNYAVNGTVCLRRASEKGSNGSPQTQVMQLSTVRLTGSDVNVTVDGFVTFSGRIMDPVLDLTFAVEKLNRNDSANYAIDNLLKFVRGATRRDSQLPLVIAMSGPLSQLRVREVAGEPVTQ